jgi:hypothetical protein
MHPRSAIVAAAPCPLNDTATDIHAGAETSLTAGKVCEQLMHVTSPMLATFWAMV